MCDIFFIVGCVRSGTTAYARILNTAENAEVFIEQEPKLLIESRELIKGNLSDPTAVLLKAKDGCINSVLQKGLKYGDKNPCYMPFIPYLTSIWKSKIVFLVRDGRDVVRSMMDWHKYRHPIFCMREDSDISDLDRPEQALWDFSRLRPNPGEPIFHRWKQLDIFQKSTWHWANYNSMALDYLSRLNRSLWMLVDVSRVDTTMIEALFDFLGLRGFDQSIVENLLSSRVNSLKDKINQAGKFPTWDNWTDEQNQEFQALAGGMMSRLGYWK